MDKLKLFVRIFFEHSMPIIPEKLISSTGANEEEEDELKRLFFFMIFLENFSWQLTSQVQEI